MIKVNGLPGFYLVHEGIIGSGKSGQSKLLPASLEKIFPGINVVSTFEPGGTKEADKLRRQLKYEHMSPEQEVSLFVDSREITLPKVVLPSLKKGDLVQSDRSFITSLAYQGFGRELGIDYVWSKNEEIVSSLMPDMVVYYQVGLEASIARSGKVKPDKFDTEGMDFWSRTEEGYFKALEFVKEISPETRIVVIDDPEAIYSIEETHEVLLKNIDPTITSWYNEGRVVRERQR